MTDTSPRPGPSRRGFLRTGVAVGAGLAAGAATPVTARAVSASTTPDGRPGAGLLGGRPTVPHGLITSLLDEPVGIATSGFRLGWIVPDLGENTRQTAYQVQLAASPTALEKSRPLVWDSGVVHSAASTAVPYAGAALRPAAPYWWRVRVWSGERRSAWSAPQRLTTAIDSWDGVPIWAPVDTTTITDGTLAADVTILTTSAGFWLRAKDSANTYLWQIFAGSPGRIRTHVFVDGSYTVLADHAVAVDVPTGTPTRIEITLTGDVITTTIGGVLVDTTTDPTYSAGTIGLRNGSTESQRYADITFTGPSGAVLVDADFADGPGVFAGATVTDGQLVLGKGQSVLAQLGESNDWSLVRTEFTLPHKPVEAAFVLATAQSPEGARQYVYKLWANGALVGRGPVRAMAGEARYHTHDVAGVLRPGRNALAALCYAAGDQRFLAQLVVVFADGTRQTIATDDGWRALRGARLLPFNGYTGGGYFDDPQEFWDLRQEPVGWTRPGFDDTGWSDAAPGTAFTATEPAAVNIDTELVTPASVTQVSPGTWIVDLGREIAGGLRLHVNGTTGTAGTAVTVALGEEIDADTVRYQLRAGNTYLETWTLRDGEQEVEHFGYRGFRWAQVSTDPTLDLRDAVHGVAIHRPWHDADSAFDCSNSDLTDVWHFARYTIEATALDVYQDTPTRERGPYEGDAYINQRSQYAVQRSYGLARYSNSFLCRRPAWPTEYHLMSVLSAWADYQATGDPDQLAADYGFYVAKNYDADLGADGLVHKAPGDSGQYDADLVDWPVANRDGYVFTDCNTVVNAFQYAAYVTLAEVATVLGKTADAGHYSDLAARLRGALNTLLLPAGAGAYVDGEGTTHTAQHATAFPVALGAAEPGDLPALGRFLAAGGMLTSVYGAQFLLDALFAAGQPDAAHALLVGTGTSSWLHMKNDLDATIVMEAWDPSVKPNTTFSHAWGSAPANVVARQILGVTVAAPGASALVVHPRPGPLTWLRGTVPTIRGGVGVAVERGATTRVEVDLPPNTTTRLEIDGAALGVDPRALRVRAAPGSPHVAVTGSVLVLDGLGSGVTTVEV